tara:strand:+ start:708 stop:1877 length:1170 start_codon:yes stop_codon:yes gene_type:complete
MKKLIGIIKKIINSRTRNFVFRKPSSEEILIYREDGKKIIFQLFSKENIKVLDPEFEINIYVLILVIFKCFKSEFFWVPYIKKYVQIVKPRIFITRIANDIKFYLIKDDHNRDTKFIAIQNGLNIGNHIFLNKSLFTNKKISLKADKIFCYGVNDKFIYQNIIESECLITGSILNNQIKKQKTNKEKNILFLSVYRYRDNNYYSTIQNEYFRPISYEEYFKLEKKMIKFLISYCKENGYKLLIAGTRESEFLVNKEKKFYEKLLESSDGWEFRPKISNISNYLLSDQSEITVNIESCLGYESFARGNKVAFFSCRGSDLKISNMDYIQNKQYGNEGPFWTSKYSEKRFKLILDKLRTITDTEWLEELTRFRKNFFLYDPDNRIAKNNIN